MQKGNQDYKNLNLENENNFLQDIVHSIRWTFRKKKEGKGKVLGFGQWLNIL